MITEERVIDVTGRLEGERVRMSIDEESTPFLMSVLTDLYSDEELAVLREYSTNALDAHVEAGITDPIEITLPSSLSPYLKIRDFGLGLDANDIRDIYSKYGASTKRLSNDVVGMLGLGCKSALTYTDQFTVESIKNGTMTIVAVSRDEDGAGSMTLVDTYETDERQGTVISIPVKGHNSFKTKADNFFRFWKPGKVLVNGEAPKRIDGIWIDEDTVVSRELDGSVIVMGNVAYPIPDVRYGEDMFAAYVDIGTVSFTPSRESLQMNSKTTEAVAAIKARVKEDIQAAAQALVEEQPTRNDALKMVASMNQHFSRVNVKTYKGEDLPEGYMTKRPEQVLDAEGNLDIKATKPWIKQRFVVVDGTKVYRRKDWSNEDRLTRSAMLNTIFLTGYTSDAFSPTKRAKLEQWMTRNGHETPQYFVLLERMPRDLAKWIDKTKVFKWDGPEAEKIERTQVRTQSNKVQGSYKGMIDGVEEDEILAEDIDTSKPLFWTTMIKPDRYSSRSPYKTNVVRHYHPGNFTIIYLGLNRIEKFQRDFPMAEGLSEFNTRKRIEWLAGLTDEDKLLLKMEANGDHSNLNGLDSTKIDDPELAAAVLAAQTPVDDLTKLSNLHNLENYQIHEKFGRFENPLDKYPLANQSRYATMGQLDHVYLYVNAVYAAEKGN